MSLFLGFGIFVLPSGFGKARLDLFRRRVAVNGGKSFEDLDSLFKAEVSSRVVVVVDDSLNYEAVFKILKLEKRGYSASEKPSDFLIVTSKWLSESLRENRVAGYGEYDVAGTLTPNLNSIQSTSSGSSTSSRLVDEGEGPPPKILRIESYCKNAYSDASRLDTPVSSAKAVEERGSRGTSEPSELAEGKSKEVSGVEEDDSNLRSEEGPLLPPGNWLCSQASARPDQNSGNPNTFVVAQLEQLCQVYKTTKDQWRQLSYRKAISALKSCPVEVKTYDQAVALPGVGPSIAEKIVEIVESGKLRKLESLGNDDKIKCMELFQKVWGVGPTYAETFYNHGFRTLEDLRSKADLTRQQRIGLKYFYDLASRMSWHEADQIRKFVEKAALEIRAGLFVEGCGSYRRKRDTCGDVDILITHPDGESHEGVFPGLLKRLHDSGFLTDDLVRDETNGKQRKYMGVCKLLPPKPAKDEATRNPSSIDDPSSIHRRIDIIVVPYDEWACARLYFTGSAIFNRSMRALAIKKGRSLSEHALSSGVFRDGQRIKVHEGNPLPTPDEQSVFRHLGIPYRPPEEREHGK